jgi:hypothetical protein
LDASKYASSSSASASSYAPLRSLQPGLGRERWPGEHLCADERAAGELEAPRVASGSLEGPRPRHVGPHRAELLAIELGRPGDRFEPLGIAACRHRCERRRDRDRLEHDLGVGERQLLDQRLQLGPARVEAPQRAIEPVGVPAAAHVGVEAHLHPGLTPLRGLAVEPGHHLVGRSRCEAHPGGHQRLAERVLALGAPHGHELLARGLARGHPLRHVPALLRLGAGAHEQERARHGQPLADPGAHAPLGQRLEQGAHRGPALRRLDRHPALARAPQPRGDLARLGGRAQPPREHVGDDLVGAAPLERPPAVERLPQGHIFER